MHGYQLRQEFEARRLGHAKANSLSLVRFECNDYSVPTEYAHHDVTVIGGIEEVYFLLGEGVNHEDALRLVERFQDPAQVEAAWQATHCAASATAPITGACFRPAGY